MEVREREGTGFMLDLMSFDKLLGCSSRRSAAKKGRVEIHLQELGLGDYTFLKFREGKKKSL